MLCVQAVCRETIALAQPVAQTSGASKSSPGSAQACSIASRSQPSAKRRGADALATRAPRAPGGTGTAGAVARSSDRQTSAAHARIAGRR